MDLLEEGAYWGPLAREGPWGERTEQKKAKRKVVLAGPWVEPGVQRANAWVVLQRGPL